MSSQNPQIFRPAARVFFASSANFQDVTNSCGIGVDNGKGLGIVVGSFGDAPGLNVFVANDTVANFYFENQGPAENGMPRFRERGLVSGLAVNGDGSFQACMGVAAGDADGDGATDRHRRAQCT